MLELFRARMGSRQRHVWRNSSRAHVELKSFDHIELGEVAREIEAEVRRRPEILWAEVHQGTRRVVFAFVEDSVTADDAALIVAEAELRAGLERATFGERVHPGDSAREESFLLELCFEFVALFVSTTLFFSVLPRSRTMGLLASIATLIRTVPRLRWRLDDWIGADRVDLLLALVAAALSAPVQRPLQNLVGVLENGMLAEEQRVRRLAFARRETELSRPGGGASLRPRLARPVPLPRGPVEDYSDRAWAVALGGFGFSLVSTRSVQRATAALFGGIPKPAALGRDTFVVGVTRLLSQRRALVLDDRALRRLDRVDCLVIEGTLVSTNPITLKDPQVAAGRNVEALVKLAHDLFDPADPLAVKERGRVRLGPTVALELEARGELRTKQKSLAQAGALTLALAEDDEIILLTELAFEARLGLEELVRAAHEADMRVIVASLDRHVLERIPADNTFAPGEEVVRGIRRLQREGRVVCVVSQGDSPALDVADLGIALVNPEAPIPWSAHVIVERDLEDVRFIIEAARGARLAARQSVKVALGAAAFGALTSAVGLGPLSGTRVLTVVHVASLISMANGARLYGEMVRRPILPARDPTPWHALPAEGALARVGSRAEGLRASEVERRRPRSAPRPRPVLELTARIGDELFNPLVPLLSAGAGVSAVIGSTSDAVMILLTLLLNAGLSGAQRFRTERAVQALTRETSLTVRVRRDNSVVSVLSSALVPGDVILLSAGDVVPADCRLLEATGLEIDAAALTGESLPVTKSAEPSFQDQTADRASMIYAGTTVARGQATALVIFTGAATEALRGALGIRGPSEESGVEKRLRELMDLTLPIAVLAGAGVIGTGLLRGRKMEELLTSAVSLAVASVPEGLPLLATAAQLAAAKRLAERGALVQNVRSLEPLGRVDTVCLDKTGTVTEGQVTVLDCFGADNALLLELAAFSSSSNGSVGATDPVDRAIWRKLEARDRPVDGMGREAELPFDHERGFTAAAGSLGTRRVIALKGIPEAIIELAAPDQATLFEEKLEEWTEQGLRVLGVAYRELAAGEPIDLEQLGQIQLAGLIAFHDPIRGSAKAALGSLREAGLRPVLVTGDHPSTARAVAVSLGIASDPAVMTGAELQVMNEEELAGRVGEIDVFARVVPAHKVRIVRALARIGRTAAMVGDGANDAPAIRLASVGVAMGRDASAAAKMAADIVILDCRIETLVDAIGEGRAMWDSVRDAVAILVGGNLGEIGFTLGAGLLSGRPPLTPRQLLLVNLFTDVAPATAIALRAPDSHELSALLRAGPEASLGVQLTRDLGARAVTTALGAGLAWSAASLIGDRRGVSTTALLALVGTQLGQTMTTVDQSREVLLTNLATMLALGLLVQTPGVSGMLGCRPLGPIGWSIALGSSFSATVLSKYGPGLARDGLEWLKERRAQSEPTRESQPALRGSFPVAARK